MESKLRENLAPGISVFETMRQDPDGRVALWPLHLARLRRGCAALGIPLDEEAAAAALAPAPGALTRLRLAAEATGALQVTRAPLPPNPTAWRLTMAAQRLDSADPWLRIKTSHRPAYDAARAALPPGCDEAILQNERGEVCEGTITSLFLRRGGALLTPALSSGLLPGVLRQSLLDQGRAREAVLVPADLETGSIFMGNALRGLIPARLA